MVFRKGRKKGSRRRYGRRAAKRLARHGNKFMSFFGVGKGGIKASRAIAATSIAIAPFIPMRTASDGGASAFDYINPFQTRTSIVGTGTSPAPYSARVIAAADCMTRAFFKKSLDTSVTSTNYAGLPGIGVATGVGLAIAGKFVNPMMSGMPAKL